MILDINDIENNQQIEIKIDEYLSEIASGMNEDRKQFNKLIDSVISGTVSKIYITYKDRLTRFGFSYFENLFKKI